MHEKVLRETNTTIKLTRAEKAEMFRRAHAAGMTLSKFVRFMCLGGYDKTNKKTEDE